MFVCTGWVKGFPPPIVCPSASPSRLQTFEYTGARIPKGDICLDRVIQRKTQTERVCPVKRVIPYVPVKINSSQNSYRVFTDKPVQLWAIVACPVMIQSGEIILSSGILKRIVACFSEEKTSPIRVIRLYSFNPSLLIRKG